MSESFITVLDAVRSQPEEARRRLLAELAKDFVGIPGSSTHAILDDSNHAIGYLVPSAASVPVPVDREGMDRITELRRRAQQLGTTLTVEEFVAGLSVE